MPRTNSSPSAGSTVVDKLKTYEGGTGQTTAAAALAALGGVPASSINQPNGVAGLDANQKLLPAVLPVDNLSVVSVQGVTSLIKGLTATFTITNYDAFATYALVAISGTVSRVNETITYTAPGAAGAGGFTLNGRQFPVAIADYAPVTPTLGGVDTAGTGNNVVGSFTGSAFAMVGNSDTHLNSDWQIATDAAFTAIVASSMADTTNKTSWAYATLAKSTTYYVRARYRSSGGFVSAWSNSLTMTTKANYVLNVEEAILAANPKTASESFGIACAITPDATRAVVMSNNAFYSFTRSGSTWTQEQKLAISATSSGQETQVSITDDGSRAAAGSLSYNFGTGSNSGGVYVFVRNGVTWTQEAALVSSDLAAGDNFGRALRIDSTGTRIVAGAMNDGHSSLTSPGSVYTFLRTGTSWAQESKLIAGDAAANNYFGCGVGINSDATRMVVGAYGATVSALTTAGKAYIYTRSGATWTQEQLLTASDRAGNDVFGFAVAMTADASRVAIGAAQRDLSSNTTAGAVYVWLRTNTTWTQEATLVASDPTGVQQMGWVLAIDPTGFKVIAGSREFQDAPTNSVGSDTGSAYVFKRVGTTWTQEAEIFPSVRTAGGQFYRGLALANGGNRGLVGAPQTTLTAVANCGGTFSFTT